MPPWTIREEGSEVHVALAGEVLGWQDIESMLDSLESSLEHSSVRNIHIDLDHVGSLAVGAVGILAAWKAEVGVGTKRLRFSASGTMAEQLSRVGLVADSGPPVTRLQSLPHR
jgi:hypothetical protein